MKEEIVQLTREREILEEELKRRDVQMMKVREELDKSSLALRGAETKIGLTKNQAGLINAIIWCLNLEQDVNRRCHFLFAIGAGGDLRLSVVVGSSSKLRSSGSCWSALSTRSARRWWRARRGSESSRTSFSSMTTLSRSKTELFSTSRFVFEWRAMAWPQGFSLVALVRTTRDLEVCALSKPRATSRFVL